MQGVGSRVSLPGGAISQAEDAGVALVHDALHTSFCLVRRLELNPASPLYPYVVESLSWPRASRRDWRARREEVDDRGPATIVLSAGLYVLETSHDLATHASTFVYLEVEHHEARWLSEAEALVRLGALEALRQLDLDDAAVALTMGDLDAARVQWIRSRGG